MSERIGKYRVLARLGQGGMARVLLTMAEGPHSFHKLLVVKELREELAHDPEFLTMFLDEARIAARLNHPNIVQTYEIGSDGDRYFLAMEYLEGQPLNAIFRRIGRPNIPLEIHLRILADVLGGLEHAHRLADFDGSPLGIVHRDVSPQNVFVTYEGSVKLVDFGIAKAAGASSRTQEGILKGKISYIAPEQARCEQVDARADLFAVGLMLWEALAGRRLVHKEDEASVLARRMSGQDPSVRTVVPQLPAELANICDKAMAARPEARFQTAREFQEVLEAYLAKSDFRVSPKEVGAMVVDAFADERERIRRAVETQVKNVDRSQEPIVLEMLPASLKITSDSLPRVISPLLSSEPPPPNTTVLTAALSSPARPRSLLPALAIGTILALGALVAVVLIDRSSRSAERPATADSAAAPTQETIQVTISFPDGARARLDGGLIEKSPFTARVRRDGSVHQLEVELPGGEMDRRTLLYEKDIDLTIPAPSPVADSKASAGPEPSAAPRVVAGGRGRPRAPVAPDKPDPAPPPKPDDEPRKPKGPKPSVEIDEQNPYKKAP